MLIESRENNWLRQLLFETNGNEKIFIFYFIISIIVNTWLAINTLFDRVEDPSNQDKGASYS